MKKHWYKVRSVDPGLHAYKPLHNCLSYRFTDWLTPDAQDMHYAEFAEDEVKPPSSSTTTPHITTHLGIMPAPENPQNELTLKLTEPDVIERHQRIRREQMESHRSESRQTC